MKQHRVFRLAFLCLALSTTVFSCRKGDLLSNDPQATETTSAPGDESLAGAGSDALGTAIANTNALASTTTTSGTTSFALPYSRTITWNHRGSGNYGLAEANADLGPTAYWKAAPTQTQTSNMLRVVLLKNALTSGGVLARVDIPDASAYTVTYNMMFAKDFDFSWGGKVGFGLLLGEGNTGGDAATDGNGGSLRLSWAKASATGPVVLKPDVYYKDQPGRMGHDFGKKFPADGSSLKKGVWYKVALHVKSNTGSLTNGSVQVLINGTTVLNQSIRWTTNDAKRFINNVCFENFRGGSESYYQSSRDGSVYFDNLVIRSTGSAAPAPTTTPTATPTATPTTTGLSTRTVNWNSRPNGTYGLSQAASDFGAASYWQQNYASQSQVYNGMLKTTLLANSLTSGGVLSRSNIAAGSEYELSFDMQFGSNFDFSYGGKVGYGLFIGDGNTGGDPAWDGNGGSLRLMWARKSGATVLIPYVYYKDQPGTYGNDFGKKFPAAGSIQKGVWYKVKMYVKSNTGSTQNGRVRVVINGTTVLDGPIRWTTNDARRLVNSLRFETFRGGAESYWKSPTNGDIYFDNVTLTQLAR